MARIKRSVWKKFFDGMLTSARRLLKHPKELRKIIEEASAKLHQHSRAIREIAGDLQTVVSLIKAWLAGDYEEISAKSIVILTGAVLYFLNPFDVIPDTIPVVGYVDDGAVVGWVVSILKDEIEKFKMWGTTRPKA